MQERLLELRRFVYKRNMRCMEGMQAFACTLLDLLVLVDKPTFYLHIRSCLLSHQLLQVKTYRNLAEFSFQIPGGAHAATTATVFRVIVILVVPGPCNVLLTLFRVFVISLIWLEKAHSTCEYAMC